MGQADQQKEIVLYRGHNAWIAKFLTDPEIVEAFNSSDIPTPYTPEARPEVVLQVIQERNPDYRITVIPQLGVYWMITDWIMKNPDLSASFFLRKFILSLVDEFEQINLWSLISALDDQRTAWVQAAMQRYFSRGEDAELQMCGRHLCRML